VDLGKPSAQAHLAIMLKARAKMPGRDDDFFVLGPAAWSLRGDFVTPLIDVLNLEPLAEPFAASSIENGRGGPAPERRPRFVPVPRVATCCAIGPAMLNWTLARSQAGGLVAWMLVSCSQQIMEKKMKGGRCRD